MKTIYKLLLALGAVLGLVAVALVLLVRGALGVADKAVDTAANTIDAVTAKAKEPDPAQQNPEQSDKTPPVAQTASAPSANAAPDANNPAANANTTKSAAKTPDTPKDTPPIAAQKTDGAAKPGKSPGKNEDEDDALASVGKILGMVFGDDAGDFNPAEVLGSSDKPDAANPADKDADKNEDKTGLAGIVPGADSPTLQKAMAGKYKGKEGQILDDALEDPKVWRLLFFLGGGM